VQKYEKGTNRISASRLHQLAGILQVPVPFFFESAQQPSARSQDNAESPNFVNEFLATHDGLTLTKAFMQIEDARLRRCVVGLVESIAGDD
jgi:transcriptional regulator with XRE-family HTH domain